MTFLKKLLHNQDEKVANTAQEIGQNAKFPRKNLHLHKIFDAE